MNNIATVPRATASVRYCEWPGTKAPIQPTPAYLSEASDTR